MKFLVPFISLVFLFSPWHLALAQSPGTLESACTSLPEKKIDYETLQQNYVPEVQEQKRLFAEFQNLRNQLQSLRIQHPSDSILTEKSKQVEILKQSIQSNQKAMEAKISALDPKINQMFFENAKEIIILTFQCINGKVQRLNTRLTQLPPSPERMEAPEIAALTLLGTNIQSTIEYLQNIQDRAGLKTAQQEMQGFMVDIKSIIQHSDKVYNYLTFADKVSQLEGILRQVQTSGLIPDPTILQKFQSQTETIKSNIQSISRSSNREEILDYYATQRIEFRYIIEELKSHLRQP